MANCAETRLSAGLNLSSRINTESFALIILATATSACPGSEEFLWLQDNLALPCLLQQTQGGKQTIPARFGSIFPIIIYLIRPGARAGLVVEDSLDINLTG